MKHTVYALVAGFALVSNLANAQIGGGDSVPVTIPANIDFANFSGSGLTVGPAAGSLNSELWSINGLSDGNFSFGSTCSSGDCARGLASGAVSTGGIYAYDTGSNIALGFQPSGSDMTPGDLTLRLVNSSGSVLTTLNVAYDIFVFNDQPRANNLTFSYSVDGTNFNEVSALDFVSNEAADASANWLNEARSTQLTNLNVADGGVFFLRWSTDDVSGSGSRDQIAIDNIALSLDGGTPTPTPLPTPTPTPTPAESNILINEVDADTAGTDVLEFVELYDGGVGNSDLSGLTLVLYNGSDDASYNAIDLSGFSTNAQGFFVIGSAGTPNVDLSIGTSNTIQNGADAVALVAGSAADFPNDTPVSTNNVVDAVVYDTNDANDAALLILLNSNQPQLNEDENGNREFDSNQRCDSVARNTDGFIQAIATPGAANPCATPTPTPTPTPVTVRKISEIQGTPESQLSNNFGETDVSPLVGEQVIVEAIVIGDFQNNDADDSRNLSGFYLQEEASDEDGNPLSSEGVFVFANNFAVDVNLGDLVRVEGTVDQFFGETQIDNITNVEVLVPGTLDSLALVNTAIIDLASITEVTVSGGGVFQPDLEAYEGMLVSFVNSLQITEQFQLDRFNEIRLVAGERPVQFSQTNTPDVIGFDAHLRAIGARTITYDDGLNLQNSTIDNLDGFAIYEEISAPRMGDTTENLNGVLDYKWAGSSSSPATWRVRSHFDGNNQFTSTLAGNSPNPRPETAPTIDGNLSIASFNVLNFFTTLDDGNTQTAVGQSPRGADDLSRFGVEPATLEFDRQRAKLVNAIVELDADILGLVEIENEFDSTNDGSTAIEVLVNAINSQLGEDAYDYVYPENQFVGTDAIAVGIIFKPAVVLPAVDAVPAILDDSVAATLDVFAAHDFVNDPIFDGNATNRPALAMTFEHIESGETITVAVNHFKSKGQSGLSDTTNPNFDQLDGAGFWNTRRTNASQALLSWLETRPTGVDEAKIMLLGDFNAYAQEDPIQLLLANGFTNVEDDDAYSFVFSGQIGTLDYGLVSDALLANFDGAAVWHINADEADALDYNVDFGRDQNYFDETTATRNSDHDPLIAAFTFETETATIGDAINRFNSLVQAGEIAGNGRFRFIRYLNLYYFKRTLILAERFEAKGKTTVACHFLTKADRLSDGKNYPRDSIKGAGVSEVNTLISNVKEALTCPSK